MTLFLSGGAQYSGGITVELHKQMWRVNNKGRCFQNGKPISPNRRCNIIDEIKSKGGDKGTGIFTRSFVDVANKFEVSNGFYCSN